MGGWIHMGFGEVNDMKLVWLTSCGIHRPLPLFLESPGLFQIFILKITWLRSWQLCGYWFTYVFKIQSAHKHTWPPALSPISTSLNPLSPYSLSPLSLLPLSLILSLKCPYHSCTGQNEVRLFPLLSVVSESNKSVSTTLTDVLCASGSHWAQSVCGTPCWFADLLSALPLVLQAVLHDSLCTPMTQIPRAAAIRLQVLLMLVDSVSIRPSSRSVREATGCGLPSSSLFLLIHV